MKITTCPDCKGKGRIELFTSASECALCGGTGQQREPDDDDVFSRGNDWRDTVAVLIRKRSALQQKQNEATWERCVVPALGAPYPKSDD